VKSIFDELSTELRNKINKKNVTIRLKEIQLIHNDPIHTSYVYS
jgi:hypothetical protein